MAFAFGVLCIQPTDDAFRDCLLRLPHNIDPRRSAT